MPVWLPAIIVTHWVTPTSDHQPGAIVLTCICETIKVGQNPVTLCASLSDMMNLTKFDLKGIPGYEAWLEAHIRQLSVEALVAQTLTCTACGEVAGTYIIDYDGQTFRLPGEETLAFLAFIVDQTQTSTSV
jgi:hypothetical protein